MSRHLAAAMAVLIGVLAGCGGDGSSGGGSPGLSVLPPASDPAPTFSSQEAVPPAAAASDAVELATQAATYVILDPFTEGHATGVGSPFLSPPEFEFTSHVEFEIDLDSLNNQGEDRFPNVSGTILVTKDGVLQGTWMAGEASYSVLIEAGTDIEAVDPDSGIETLIPQGSSWTCSLGVTWEITDSQNWLVVATATKAVEVSGLTVTDGDAVTSVSVSGGRQVTTAFAKVDGEFAKETTIEGSVTVTIDDGQSVVEVLIEFQNDGTILVTVGDDVFGPFTPAEFRQFVQDNLRI